MAEGIRKAIKLTADEAKEYFEAYITNAVQWKARYNSWDAKKKRPVPTPESVASDIRRDIVMEWLRAEYSDFYVNLYRAVKPTYEKILKLVRASWPARVVEEDAQAVMDSVVESANGAVLRSMTIEDLEGQGLSKAAAMEAHALAKSYYHHVVLARRLEGVNLIKGYSPRGGSSLIALRSPADMLKAQKRKDVSPADKKRAEKEYGNVEYADEKNKKYPLDKEHIHSAISYFAKPKNSGEYDEKDRKAMARKILAAANKHGVEVSDEWKKKFGLEKSFFIKGEKGGKYGTGKHKEAVHVNRNGKHFVQMRTVGKKSDADIKSGAAYAQSEMAIESGKKSDHLRAAEMHSEASEAHHKEAEGSGSIPKKSREHSQMAVYHRKKANELGKKK